MTIPDETAIPLSRTKLVGLTLVSIAFVLLCGWMFGLGDAQIRPREPLFVHGLALVGILFFGFGIFVLVRKLSDSRPGLLFSPAGITDNSNGIAVGFIPWSEIMGFEVSKIRSTRFLVVKLLHPQKYLATRGVISRYFSRATLSMYGTPVALASTALAIEFDDLIDLFQGYLRKYGVKQAVG